MSKELENFRSSTFGHLFNNEFSFEQKNKN